MVGILRSTFKTQFPRIWAFARGVKDRAVVEYYLLRHLRWRQLLKDALGASKGWESVLPLQAARRVPIQVSSLESLEALVKNADAQGLGYGQGSCVIYLPPATIAHTPLNVLLRDYPKDAGIKILRTAGGVGESTYGPGVLRKLIDRDLLLVANLLNYYGLGPRIYDLVELQFADQVLTAYILQHIEGRPPTEAECMAGVARLRELEQHDLLKTTSVWGYGNVDFQPPSCNGNAVIDGDGQFHYIDFQNFVLGDYAAHLTATSKAAVENSHFGRRRLLGDGLFLYQSIPGVRMPAKRDVALRASALAGLMESAGVSVKHRLVLDVGCNIGMMMGQYLRLGAKWCHGWDHPHITPYTERLLYALGCTRFSTTGRGLSPDRPLEADVPDFLRPSLDGCVVSYLAVRGHIGWLESLSRIPWSALIYEGHETDSPEDVEEHLRELARSVEFDTRAITTYEDGASCPRVAAILVRRQRPSEL